MGEAEQNGDKVEARDPPLGERKLVAAVRSVQVEAQGVAHGRARANVVVRFGRLGEIVTDAWFPT